jgi:hypothetical protein
MGDEIQKITHIVGERVFWNVRLKSPTGNVNLTSCEVSFRGKLNDKTLYQKEFNKFDTFTIRFSANELVDESADRKLDGRFFFAFQDGSVRTSQKFLIVVKE